MLTDKKNTFPDGHGESNLDHLETVKDEEGGQKVNESAPQGGHGLELVSDETSGEHQLQPNSGDIKEGN